MVKFADPDSSVSKQLTIYHQFNCFLDKMPKNFKHGFHPADFESEHKNLEGTNLIGAVYNFM